MAIIAVTARAEERDRCLGLRSGADDYVVKPFGMAELQARIDAVMRRAARSAGGRRGVVTAGPVTINLDAHVVTVDGTEVALTRKEFDLLAALARRPGAVVTRGDLLADVWGSTWTGDLHTVVVHIGFLRRKLGDPSLIQTVRGVGYRLRGLPADPPGPG